MVLSGALKIFTISGRYTLMIGPYPDASCFGMSRRELEVLKYMTDGVSGKQIADKLVLSIYTIYNHRKNMLEKNQLQKYRRAALFCYGMWFAIVILH